MESKLKRSKIIAYAMPAVPISALGLPLVVHLPPFYVNATGLSVALIGVIFMVLRLWDVITDPVMGWAADRFEMKGGKRRGWMVLSLPFLMLPAWMVFSPPAGIGWQYLFFWMLILYIGWTMITIAHLSWGAELSDNYHDRSRVHGFREAFLIVGYLAVLSLPVWAEYNAAAGELRPGETGIQIMGLFIVVLLPITVGLAVWRVGEMPQKAVRTSWRATWATLKKNRPLRFLLGADFALSFSAGTVSAMFFFLTLHVLQLDRLSSNVMLLCYFAIGVLFVPLLLRFADTLGKHKTQFLSAFITVITIPVILFVPAGSPAWAFVAWGFLGMNMAVGATLMRSMAADVNDVEELETGVPRMGMFYALLTMTSKMGYAFAIGITYGLLGYLGFSVKVENSPEVLNYVRQTYVFVPVVMNLITMWLMAKYPISRKQQEENRRLIEVARQAG